MGRINHNKKYIVDPILQINRNMAKRNVLPPTYVCQVILFFALLFTYSMIHAQNKTDTTFMQTIKEEVFIKQNKKMISSKRVSKAYLKKTEQAPGSIVSFYQKKGQKIKLTAYTETRPVKHKSDLNYVVYSIVVRLTFDTITFANECFKQILTDLQNATYDPYMVLKSGFLLAQEKTDIWFILIPDCGTRNTAIYEKLKPKMNTTLTRVSCALGLADH